MPDPADDAGKAARASASRRARAARIGPRGARVVHGARRAARASGAAARRGWRGVRRTTHAHGAGESGLGTVIEVHGVSAAGDALVAVALANTLFFDVPIGEARPRVALYLLLTLAPFALLAPVVGPMLDRLRGGRRWALAGTFALRAVLAVGLAGALDGSIWLYPLAFGVLVLSRAYAIGRMAMVPRLLPRSIGLVRANSRISLAGIATATVAVPAGLGISVAVGAGATLWLAATAFLVGAVLTARLPSRADAIEAPTAEAYDPDLGEPPLGDPTYQREAAAPPYRRRTGRAGWRAAAGRRAGRQSVILGLRANAALRGFSGFLVFFIAFKLRADPMTSLGAGFAIAVAAAGLAAGGAGGTYLGERLRRHTPELTIAIAVSAASVAALLGAALWGLFAVVFVMAASGATQAIGKLSLDAVIQRDVPEDVRSSAFGRSETLLQLAWAVGGGLGTVLPLSGSWGLALVGVTLAVAGVATWVERRRGDRARQRRSTTRRARG